MTQRLTSFLIVLHLVESPALSKVASALKPRGKILIIDMVAHDREEHRQTMGHVSLGFSAEKIHMTAHRAGLKVNSTTPTRS